MNGYTGNSKAVIQASIALNNMLSTEVKHTLSLGYALLDSSDEEREVLKKLCERAKAYRVKAA